MSCTPACTAGAKTVTIEPVKLYYKTCRENAGLTQDEAVLYLNIADVSTLSKYENGRLVPDQQIVAKMVILYRVPSLAIWHIRHTNPALAQYLPEITELKSEGDVYLQGALATDMLLGGLENIKRIMSKKIDTYDNPELQDIKAGLKTAADKVMSMVNFIDDKTCGSRN